MKGPLLDRIPLGVVDENEIFRRGVVACLAADSSMQVVYDSGSPDKKANVRIVVASTAMTEAHAFGVPVVICTDVAVPERCKAQNDVVGVLPRSNLRPAQLVNGIRAAASGLQVNMLDTPAGMLSPRHVEVLRLLAAGAATRQMADQLGYSERTIKHAVAEILEELGARSRAEAVALGIRRGLI